MKVILINPVRGLLPPFGLIHIAAVLEKEGHEVKIVELPEYPEHEHLKKNSALLEAIVISKPDILGMGFIDAFRNEARALIEYFKEKVPGTPIILGGHYPSNRYEKVLNWGADYVVVGEGENTILELVRYLRDKQPEPKSISGLAYKNNGNVFFNGYRTDRVDLNQLPFPSYHLINYDAYVKLKIYAIRGWYIKAGVIFTGRGCPGRCTFCYTALMQKKIRFRPVNRVVDEIEFQIAKYNLDGAYFLDDTFTISESRVIDICNEILRRNIKTVFACQARADTFNENMAKHMKKAGFMQVEFGVESGSQKVLDSYKKHITVEQIERAFGICKKYNMATFANLIIGAPNEHKEDIEQTKNLLRRVKPDVGGIAFLTPHPGTELFELATKNGWVEEETIDYKQTGDNPSLCINFTKEELIKIRDEMYAIILPSIYTNMLGSPSFIRDMLYLIMKRPKFAIGFLKSIRTGRANDAINLFKSEVARSVFSDAN